MLQDGCIASVTASGRVLPAVRIETSNNFFGFPSPATDATGNTFINYNPGRFDGVVVLIPTDDGFEDIGLDDSGYSGRLAYYYAEVIGPGSNGEFVIRQWQQDCTPSCAEGADTSEDLHWNGSGYAAANPSAPIADSPTGQPASPAPPSVNLESSCSNPEWRNANGAEGDRLCGAPNPYG